MCWREFYRRKFLQRGDGGSVRSSIRGRDEDRGEDSLVIRLFVIVVKHIEYRILILTKCVSACTCTHTWAMHTCGSQRLSSATIYLVFEIGILTFI